VIAQLVAILLPQGSWCVASPDERLALHRRLFAALSGAVDQLMCPIVISDHDGKAGFLVLQSAAMEDPDPTRVISATLQHLTRRWEDHVAAEAWIQQVLSHLEQMEARERTQAPRLDHL
jgi:hypothetical protein